MINTVQKEKDKLIKLSLKTNISFKIETITVVWKEK